jgi:hypothetical protein
MPTQGLIEFEKLFDMPALWIVNSQILDFVPAVWTFRDG